MKHGEQHIVHPFFQQVLSKPETTQSQSHSFLGLPSDVKHRPHADRDPRVCEQPVGEEPQLPIMDACSPEGDPNANRRKRRKMDRPKATEAEATLQTGLSGWLGKEPIISVDPVPLKPNLGPDATSQPCISFTSRPASRVPGQQDLPASTIELTPLDLDSSTQIPRGNKRGRSQKHNSKIAVIPYNPTSPRNIGSLIDGILQGLAKSKPAAPKPTSVTRNAQPAKPTHPFFLKKASQKPQTDSTGDPPLNQSPDLKLSPPVQGKLEATFSSKPSGFARRTNKFPELVHPLWPPQGLVHVRSLDIPEDHKVISKELINDQKKSKLRRINISDEENVILSSTHSAREKARLSLKASGDTRTGLRHPIRNAASGRVLQAAIDRQLSSSLPQLSSMPIPSNRVITKLRSALLSSVSAFDCGKYESQLWAHKYAPKVAEEVLQVGREVEMLRDWLRHLKINAVDTGKPTKDGRKSKSKSAQKGKNRRKPAEKLEGFIVSSEEEASEMENISGSDDELAGDVTVASQKTVVRSGDLASGRHHGDGQVQISNAVLLSGPSGSGKTASVYAVAKELDFEVFEINPGSRRSARDMLERVGDMTQNHLVHLLNDSDEPSTMCRNSGPSESSKQNKLKGFFKTQPSTPTSTANDSPQSNPKPDSETKRRREQKQSLILIEEADILFDEDKQFWTGILTLISQSRRPIVITCNDESLVPIQGMSLHAILRYQQPPRDLVLDYLLLVAANEGHVLKRDAVSKLFTGCGFDIRRALMDLNLWCQIGVGSEKAGLDWILPQWPPGANVDQNGDRVRVLSLNTYEPYMGWFNRDSFLEGNTLDKEADALRNSFHWWDLGIQDLEDAGGFSKAELVPLDQFRFKSNLEKLELLDQEVQFAEMRSTLDILSTGCSSGIAQDVMDTTTPPMLESHRSNYSDAYPLLQTDVRPEYTSLCENMSITFDALLSRVFRAEKEDLESTTATQIFNGWAKSAHRLGFTPSVSGLQKVFEPVRRAYYYLPVSTGRVAASFENGLGPIIEDIAPYVRAIMVFDVRLKQYRDHLHAIWAQQQGPGETRTRTTRASRAALEGSDKGSTRRERWFPDDTNYFLVQGTGMPEWQRILFQMGHFHVESLVETPNERGDHARSG
ncbi:hypothetical protein N7512_001901 [Penicillium capsulatum]|nr:hypothetical protein N7512_001901 [Penicillium capsulatum]